jgi:hypothetical protein
MASPLTQTGHRLKAPAVWDLMRVSLDNWFTVVAVSHEEFFVDHRNLEDECNTFLRNVWNHFPSNAASHPKRPESTPTL